MRRRTFAEVSRAVTKKTTVKSELKKRVSTGQLSKLKRRDTAKSSLGSETPRLTDVEDNDANDSEAKQTEKPPEAEATEEAASVPGEVTDAPATECGSPGEDETGDAEVVVLGGEAPAEDGEEEDEEDEKKQENESSKSKMGRFKKLSKKQLRLQQERLEEEREKEERRKRREERKRKKELQAQLAQEAASQSFDEAAYRESIYKKVKTSLGLVMNQGDLNITVDNLTPLMNSLELDTSDEDVKDLILSALLDSYGLIEPSSIDSLVMKKQAEKDLEDLEDCVDAAFAIIDVDRDGIITHNDVYRLMIHLGEVLWDDQVSAILKEADIDGDGKISKKDLFLFLLGREKRVKLEDQILNKFGGKQDAEEPSKETTTASAAPSTTEQAPEMPPKTAENGTVSSTTSNSTAATAATVKPAQLTEEEKAAERRRKMFTGYSKLVIASKPLSQANDSLGIGQASDKKEDHSAVVGNSADKHSAEGESEKLKSENEQKESGAEKDVVLQVPEINKNENKDIKGKPDPCPAEMNNDPKQETPAAANQMASSDWSDSGHVGSERGEDDTYGDDSDDNDDDDDEEELQFAGPPLALEAGIAYLPAPEFDAVAPPDSPHTARSKKSSVTFSPRPVSQLTVETELPQRHSPENADHDSSKKQETDTLCIPDLDIDGVEALASPHTERTSEYDSEREGDEDSLPETSQQNAILREIELQVLHAKEALKAKGPCLAGVPLKQKYADMLTEEALDGCESVVESEIHPVYVPRCAKDNNSGRRFSLYQDRVNALEDPEIAEDILDRDSVTKSNRLVPDKQDGSHLMTGDHYASSTTDILSKGYVSFSSPRSASTLMTKLPLNELVDDVFLPSANVSKTPTFYPSIANKTDFVARIPQNRHSSHHDADEGLLTDSDDDGRLDVLQENEPNSFRLVEDVVVDGTPHDRRPLCERAHNQTARRQARAPLRRSLTCHTVTIKDLSSMLHKSLSPPCRQPSKTFLVSRNSSVGATSRSSSRSQSKFQNDSSSSERESHLSRRQAYLRGRASSACSADSQSNRKPLNSNRTQSLIRTQSPQVSRVYSPTGQIDSYRKTQSPRVSRVYSPTGRIDSYRSQGFDSYRAKESSRSQKNSSRSVWESSYLESQYSHRASSRSQKDTWRSQLDSHRSKKDSSRGKCDTALTFRSEEQRRDRSCEDDVEESRENKEEEFRFRGPNFDLIMSQKGESKEHLRDSLRRDGFLASHRQNQLANDVTLNQNGGVESRKAKISQQLERVKEMEALIRQRRDNMGLDLTEDDVLVEKNSPKSDRAHYRDRQHTLRRCKTMHMTIHQPSTQSDHTNPSGKSVIETGAQRVRPKSCMAGKRTTSDLTPKNVTIADNDRACTPGRPGSSKTHSDPADRGKSRHSQTHESKEQAMHVIDLSSLLSNVNDPEQSADDVIEGNQTERSHGATFKPLARVLVAYENSRRRQAATVAGNSDSTPTSISRQLQQGIPYRTPRTSTKDDRGTVSPSPRKKTSMWTLDSRGLDDITKQRAAENFQIRNHPKKGNHSFVLSAGEDDTLSFHNQHSSLSEQAAYIENLFQRPGGYHDTRSGQRWGDKTMVLEFPERSVCVLKPVTAVVPDAS